MMKRIKFLIFSLLALLLLLSCEAPIEQPSDYKAAELKNGGPEISVYLGADEIASKSGVVHFGLLKAGEFKEHTLIIKNSGSEELVIDTTQIKIVPAEAFSLPSLPAELKVAPGSSVDLNVRFNYQKWKTSEAYLYLFSNDSDESIYWFGLKGASDSGVTGVQESINVTMDGTELLFGGEYGPEWVRVKHTERTEFTITNNMTIDLALGTLPIEVKGIDSSEFKLIQPTVEMLKVGESTTFSITLTPSNEGVRSAVVVIKATKPLFSFIYKTEGGDPHINLFRFDVEDSSGYNFSGIRPGTQELAVKFTVKQTGMGKLDFTKLPYINSIKGGTGDFVIFQTPEFRNAGGIREAEIVVKFSPESYGESEAELVIHSNCSANSVIRVALSGKGVWGRIIDLYNRQDNSFLAESSHGELVVLSSGSLLYRELIKIDRAGNLSHKNLDLDRLKVQHMVISRDDYIYIAGYGDDLVSRDSNSDWFIKKFSLSGQEDLSWNKKYSSNNYWGGYNESVYSLALDSAGNLYAGGNGIDLINRGSNNDWWLKKFSSSGVEDIANWNKKISGIDDKTMYYQDDVIYSLAVDSSGNLYAGGYGANLVTLDNSKDWWIKKFSSSGTEDLLNWNKSGSYGAEYGTDMVTSLVIDREDNIFSTICDTQKGYTYLKKFDSIGNEDILNWNKKLAMFVRKSIIDNAGNIYLVGTGAESVNGRINNYWLIKKFGPDGVEDILRWNKKIKFTGNQNKVYSALIDSDGNLIVLGLGYVFKPDSRYFDDELIIKKFSPDGVEL